MCMCEWHVYVCIFVLEAVVVFRSQCTCSKDLNNYTKSVLPHTVVCSPQCANGTGVCVANNTCSCAPGYLGDTCSEQGELQ